MEPNSFQNNEHGKIDENHPFAVAMRLNAMRRGIKWIDTYKYTSHKLS